MIFGSRPSRATALRIAARSTISGTPVKSCNTMRATTNGISALAGDFAFQFASVSTSLLQTFLPSQLRSTDSSTIRMLTGNREIFPTPFSSSAGSENRKPARPLPASNFVSALNSSCIFVPRRTRSSRNWDVQEPLCSSCPFVVHWKSFQFPQLGLDPIEIRQLPCVVIALYVLDHAIFIDDERRSFGHAAHSK